MNKTSLILLLSFCVVPFAQEAPTGSIVEMKTAEKKQLAQLEGAVEGLIAWSSSRSNSKHDIWIMDADGNNQRQLTSGDNVDWYPRFCPTAKRVLFTRSKSGWVPEGDAEIFDKWDLWIIQSDGNGLKKAAENATWGTWRPTGDSIVFARGAQVYSKDLKTGGESLLFDASVTLKKGAYAQQPQLSPDGTKLAMTVRGSRRETGIWNLRTSTWYSTGEGCQMEWFPDGKKIMRMNEGQGNGGTEVLLIDLDENGKPSDKIAGLSIPKKIRFMDLPGRRSHEYFPKVDRSAAWLVWCATQTGHEHDIADYELYLWKIGSDKKSGPVRLTFHSGNDRWPDIYIGKKPAYPGSGAITPSNISVPASATASAENATPAIPSDSSSAAKSLLPQTVAPADMTTSDIQPVSAPPVLPPQPASTEIRAKPAPAIMEAPTEPKVP
jgi:hypothetical protein